MSKAYQDFLDFFSLTGRERLEGLSPSYFEAMTPEEREKAFDFLLEKVRSGGSEESIHGIFRANPQRAVEITNELMDQTTLRPEAEIVAAWNIYKITHDSSTSKVFAKYLKDSDAEVRGKAAYYVPSDLATPEILDGLKGMILVETEKLSLIHAVNKLLECYGITEDSTDKSIFRDYYRGLRDDNPETKKRTFSKLEKNFPIAGR